MMGSKREEERNEKIIRGLMKLPPNRRCINCNCVGPQYVCTNFWTFVCSTCSGIHREFTHRVKSVSMSKFSTQEVNALQQGGNQRARDIYLKNWDMTRMRLPESSNADRIRDFIRSVYVNKKYFAEKPSEKPPTDTESPMANENDLRRPSSYHSFSQSPPYDYQYEERRYGKNLAPAPKRLGSELGGYTGKISSFGSQSVHEDRFANERSSGSRFSDFSGPQRTSSSGSFGSFDDNVHEQPVGGANQLVVSSLMSSSYLPPLVKPTQQIDLFAGFNEQNVPTKPGPAAVSPIQVQTNKPGPAATNAPSEIQVQTNKPVPVPVNAQSQVQTNKPGPAVNNVPAQVQTNKPVPVPVNAQSQVQTNKPGPAVNNVPAQVQTNKPGPVTTNAPSQVKTSKPVPSVDLFAGFDNQQQDWANFDSPQKEQVVAKPSVQPSPVVVPAAKPNVQPSLVVAKPSVQPSVQSSPVVVATGDDLMRGGMGPVTVPSAVVPPQIVQATVPTNQERSQAWNAFGESSGNINQVVSAPSVQLSPLNELVVPLPVPVPVQGTYTPVPVPTQINAHALALAPANQNQLEPWNAFGESRGTINQFNAQVNSVPSAQMSALVPVGTNIPEATGTQIPLQSTMSLRDNNVPTNLSFPQSWNANENTMGNMPVNNVYGNIPLNNFYPIHSLPENTPYDQQYIGHIFSKVENYPSTDTLPPNMNAPVPTSFHSLQGMMPPHRTKSTNPFDFPEESDIQPNNNNMYMDMSSLQAALPAQQAPTEFYSNSSFATQYYSPNPQSTMQYMSGGQGPTPQSSYPSLGGNPFA